MYVDGWGYDPDYRDHRAFGDETWTIAVAHLLNRAGLALIDGDPGAAREAYRRLFDAMEAEYDEGGFPGAGTPEELVDADTDEAKHRYLRAVWDSEPVETRAAALLAAMEETAYLGERPSLASLEASCREPLADLETVLSDLIARLAAVPAGYGFGTQARRLLTEVTERHGGVDGLGELARTPGDQQADDYRDWIDALVRAGRTDEARQAAVEAFEELEPEGRVIAAIAERRALLAANNIGWPSDRLRPNDGLDALCATLTDHDTQAAIDRYRAIPPDDLLLSTLLTARLEHDPPHAAERERWLTIASRHVDARIDRGGRRPAPRRLRARRPPRRRLRRSGGARSLAGRSRPLPRRPPRPLPRHSSFRRELRTVVAQSPLLG